MLAAREVEEEEEGVVGVVMGSGSRVTAFIRGMWQAAKGGQVLSLLALLVQKCKY